MVKTIIQLIAISTIAISIFLITDSKEIAKKHFSRNEEYNAVKILKITGLIISWLGMSILYMAI